MAEVKNRNGGEIGGYSSMEVVASGDREYGSTPFMRFDAFSY